MNPEQYTELIDKYLNSTLSDKESELFEQLKNDPSFVEELQLQEELQKSIISFEKQNLHDILNEEHNHFEQQQKYWSTLKIASIIIIVIALLVFLFYPKQSINTPKTPEIKTDTTQENTNINLEQDTTKTKRKDTISYPIDTNPKIITNNQVQLDTLWFLKDSTQVSFTHLEKYNDSKASYTFFNDTLKIYSVTPMLMKTYLSFIYGKYYLSNYDQIFEIQKAKKLRELIPVQDIRIKEQVRLYTSQKSNYSVYAEQIMTKEAEEKAKITIFTLTVFSNEDKTIQFDSEKLTLSYTKDFPFDFHNAQVILLNGEYYLQQDKQFFTLPKTKEFVSELKKVEDKKVLQYFNTNSKRLKIYKRDLQKEALQYSH